MKSLLVMAALMAAVTGGTTYTVQPGDTLGRIAGEVYGSSAQWPRLAELNGLAEPYTIVPGQVLKLAGDTAAAVPPPRAAAPALVPLTPAPTPVPPLVLGYRVEPAPVAAGERPLTLAAALDLAQQHNLTLKSSALTVRGSAISLASAQSAFQPSLTSSIDHNWSQTQSAIATSATHSDQTDYSLGVGQSLPSSASYDVTVSQSRSHSAPSSAALNPSWSPDVTLSVTQPLLEGRGREVAAAGVITAEHGLTAAEQTARRTRAETLTGIENAYWTLAKAEAEEQVARASLAVAESLLERNRELLARGLIAGVELLTAQSGVASRRESLIAAGTARADAAEALAFAVFGESAPRLTELLRTVPPLPEIPAPYPLETLERAALAQRPDLAAGREELSSARAELVVAENRLLPEVNLTGSVGTGGTAGSFDRSWSELGENREPNWSTGLSLSVPFGGDGDRASHQSAQLAVEQEELALVTRENSIRQEVRAAWRAVVEGQARLVAAIESRRLNEAQLTAEEQRLELGLGDTLRVLQTESSANSAYLSEIEARTALAQAAANLRLAVGE